MQPRLDADLPIYDGPSKEELSAALFDQRQARFALDAYGMFLYVTIQTVHRLGLQLFEFTGSYEDSSKGDQWTCYVVGHYNVVTRKGSVKISRARPLPKVSGF